MHVFCLQGPSLLREKWLQLPESRGEGLQVAYQVKTYQYLYEPVFLTSPKIGSAGFPPFDERFVGYDNDRVSQVNKAPIHQPKLSCFSYLACLEFGRPYFIFTTPTFRDHSCSYLALLNDCS